MTEGRGPESPPAVSPGLVRARAVGGLAARLLHARRGAVWLDPGQLGGTAGAHEQDPIGRAVATALDAGSSLRLSGTGGTGEHHAAAGTPALAVDEDLLAVPVRSRADLRRLGVLYVVDTAPREWTGTDEDALATLAAGVAEAVELDALLRDAATERTRRDLSLTSGGVGSFDWDLVHQSLELDDQLTALFAYPPGTVPTAEEFLLRVHPDDRPGLRVALEHALAGDGVYEAEYRIIRPDGTIRWVTSRGRAMPGPAGGVARVVGVAQDTTGLRANDARVARVLETMPTAFFSVDHDWCLSYVNAEAEALLGRPRRELLGRPLREVFPIASESDTAERVRTATATGEPTSFEVLSPVPPRRWYDVRVWPGPEGLSVYLHDVTESRAARDRLALLDRVASELAGTLDAEDAVARLARLVVPTLGDWSIVTLIDQDRPGPAWHRLRDIGWWHTDPELRPLVQLYAELRLSRLTAASFLARALTSGAPAVVRGGATEAVSALLGGGPAQDVYRRLAPDDLMVVPLRAHGRTLGLLSVYRSTSGPGTAVDGGLATAVDVAARAALALDNARLYEQQRGFSESLQRSLLSAPPDVEGLELAVRYEPAAEAARIGGDWYDAFTVRPGSTTVVIGDVVGHDMAAAAAMGQVRAVLRGIAAATGEGPAAVLDRLDAALGTLGVDVTATVVMATFEATPSGTTVRWATAGHPPPVAVTTDGEFHDLATPAGHNLLIGLHGGAARAEQVLELAPGTTVVLFTDGLVERRGERYQEGLARLRAVLGDVGHRDVDAVADALLRRLLPGRHPDDVALAVIRTGQPGGQPGVTT